MMKTKNILLGCGGLLLTPLVGAICVIVYLFVYFGPAWTGPTDFGEQRYRLAVGAAAARGLKVEGLGTWPILTRACDATRAAHERVMGTPLEDREGMLRWPDVFDHGVEKPDRAKAGAIIAGLEAAGVFADLDAVVADPGAIAPAASSPATTAAMNKASSERSTVRQLVRVCAYRFREDVAAGRSDDAVANLRRILALARVSGAQGSMLDSLVEIACIARLCTEVRTAVLAGNLPEPMLEAMQRVMDGIQTPDLRLALEGERLVGLGSLHQELGDSRIVAMSRGANMHFLNRYYDALLPLTALDARERRNAVAALSREQGAKLGAYPAVELLLPSVDGFLASDMQLRLEIAATSTMLSIERARLIHGQPPASLDALGALRPKVSPDPFSADGNLVYRVDAASPRGYVLYSVGLDGRDNNGATAKATNYESLRESGAGTDFVIIPPHPVGI